MSTEVNIPIQTFELIFGAHKGKDDDEIIRLVTQAVEEAFKTAVGIAMAEANNCSLKYLDISSHPYRDMGGWRDLSAVNPELTREIPDGTECLALNFPFSADKVQILKDCAPAFEIAEGKYPDVVNALIILSHSLKQLSLELDQNKIKPVIRGLEKDLEKLSDKVKYSGMGGILDTAASAYSAEVWENGKDRPASAPFFFVFT